jgi:hypothetical protein
MKGTYSAKTTILAIQRYIRANIIEKVRAKTGVFISDEMCPVPIHVFFNAKELAYDRAKELAGLKNVFLHVSTIPKRKSKQVDASDREMERRMRDFLFRKQDYDHVVLITGDSDFTQLVKDFSIDNPALKFHLIFNYQAKGSFVSARLMHWASAIKFDDLFSGLEPDRVPPRTLKLQAMSRTNSGDKKAETGGCGGETKLVCKLQNQIDNETKLSLAPLSHFDDEKGPMHDRTQIEASVPICKFYHSRIGVCRNGISCPWRHN